MRIIAESADALKAGCALGDEWPDAEDKAVYDEHVAVLNRLEAFRDAEPTAADASHGGASVPEGFALVPIEPTQEMLHAGNRHIPALHVYRAMLAAAPHPSASAAAPAGAGRLDEEIALLRRWYELSAEGKITVSDPAYVVVTQTAALLAARAALQPAAPEKTGGETLEGMRDKWKIVDGDCREGANGLITYHVEAFDEGYRAALVTTEAAVEPVATLHDDGHYTWHGDKPHDFNYAGWRMKVYTHPASEPQSEAGAAYSAPFTTDVPQCCGDPTTCNDPCGDGVRRGRAADS